MSVANSLRALIKKYGPGAEAAFNDVRAMLGFDPDPVLVERAVVDKMQATPPPKPAATAKSSDKSTAKSTAKSREKPTAKGTEKRKPLNVLPRGGAQGSRETVFGSRTGIMPELVDAPYAVRQEMDDRVRPIMYDEQGMDRIAQGFGLQTAPAFQGPGIFEGINPGVQARYAVDTYGNQMSRKGQGQMGAVEDTYGLLTGQTATAGNQFFPGAQGIGMELPLGRPLRDEEALRILDVQSRLGVDPNSMAIVPSPQGVRMADFSDDPEAFRRFIAESQGAIGAGDPVSGNFSGYYKENPWETPEGQFGQAYLESATARPEYARAFNSVAPEIAERLRGTYRNFARENQMAFPEYFDTMLGAIAGGGEKELRELIRRRGYAKGGAVEGQLASDAMHLAEKYGLA